MDEWMIPLRLLLLLEHLCSKNLAGQSRQQMHLKGNLGNYLEFRNHRVQGELLCFAKIKLHPCTRLHWIALDCSSNFVCFIATCVLIDNQLVGRNTWKSVGEKCCFNHQYLVSADGCSAVQGASSIEPSSTIIKSTMTMINTSIV